MKLSFLSLGLVVALLLPVPVHASDPLDFDTAAPPGHWFTETNGFPVPVLDGYGVFDTPTYQFWSAFQRAGGVGTVGFPVSGEFVFVGFLEQAMQKAVFQWNPQTNDVEFVNIFDRMHDSGKDGWLQVAHQIPPPADTSSDAGKPWAQVVADHQALLAGNPAIRAAYFADSDPVAHFGLPMTAPIDEGNVVVVRCQRAALQQWKEAVPWAVAGQVTVANGGDLAKEAGIIPPFAVGPFAPNFAFISGGPIRKDAATVTLRLRDLPPGYTLVSNTRLDQAIEAAQRAQAASGEQPQTTAPSTSTGSAPIRGHTTRPTPSLINTLQHGMVDRDTGRYVAFDANSSVALRTLIDQVDAYRSVEGAQWRYREALDQAAAKGSTPVAVPALGDETAAGVGKVVRASDNAPGQIFTVVFRIQNITAITEITYFDGSGSMDLTIQLARVIRARILAGE